MTLTKRLVGGNPLVSVYIVFYSLFYFFSDLVAGQKQEKPNTSVRTTEGLFFWWNNPSPVPGKCSGPKNNKNKKIIKKRER